MNVIASFDINYRMCEKWCCDAGKLWVVQHKYGVQHCAMLHDYVWSFKDKCPGNEKLQY